MLSLKRRGAIHIKNLLGWKTNRKLVVLSFDDYGNVFTASKTARENLINKGLPIEKSRFAMYDALETAQDLEAMYETLLSVRDTKGNHPVITAFALPANIDFDRVVESGYQTYFYEKLPDTFRKLPQNEGAWTLWKEGMEQKLLSPQFHGREHLNVKLFETLLRMGHKGVIENIKERSYAGIEHDINNVGFTEAFSFENAKEIEEHRAIIKDGVEVFEEVFNVKPVHFNAPGAREHSDLSSTISDCGMKMIDTDILKKEHQGKGKYKYIVNKYGSKNEHGGLYIYRNCVFEPSMGGMESVVNSTLKEIEIAFKHGKPANISSHRVNFSGGIEEENRKNGLNALKMLLNEILKRWPEAEFISSAELFTIMNKRD